MSFAQFMGWMQIAQIGIPLGISTVESITAGIRAAHGTTMSEEDLNAAITLIMTEDVRRKALAIDDAMGVTK